MRSFSVGRKSKAYPIQETMLYIQGCQKSLYKVSYIPIHIVATLWHGVIKPTHAKNIVHSAYKVVTAITR